MSLTSIASPRITVARAPMRSACLSWPFSERPACSISTRTPSSRRRARQREGVGDQRPAWRGRCTRGRPPPARLLGRRQQDALDRPRPSPPRAWAARRAPRSAGRSARRRPAPPARRAARTRTRTPCACSSRARARASSRPRSCMPAASSSARTAAKCSASSGLEAVEQPRRVAPSPPACRDGRRRRRAAGSGRGARAPRCDSSPSRARR